jgi:20S proteasome alpha/beta subunit
MYQSASEYDRNVNTFSPDGRLLQVEYAIEAVKLGSSVIAILCPEGVIFAVEKRLSSPLLIPSRTGGRWSITCASRLRAIASRLVRRSVSAL